MKKMVFIYFNRKINSKTIMILKTKYSDLLYKKLINICQNTEGEMGIPPPAFYIYKFIFH